MKIVEIVTLSSLLFSIFIFSLGSILYLRKIMLQHAIDLELQLAVLGFIFILLALIVSKILSKVEFNG